MSAPSPSPRPLPDAFRELLVSYVPTFIAEAVASDTPPVDAPPAVRQHAAILFADISGFTQLTEGLAERGPSGAEEVAHVLNHFFAQLLDGIAAHGGDVVKFAGDGLLALWPAAPEGLGVATQRAAACALAAQAALGHYPLAAGGHLTLRLGIGAGTVFSAQLGGGQGRWEILLVGPAVQQAGHAHQQAAPGQVVLAASARAQLGEGASGDPLPGRCFHLRALADSPAPRPLIRPTLPAHRGAALQRYLPGAILARLHAGQGEWLAELRRVTVLFVALPDMDHRRSLDEAQAIMRALQRAIYRYEGSINKLNVDEKGVSLVAAFGLPPLAHEDDPVRGVRAAEAVRAELRALGLACAVGVTTGRVFCGEIGHAARREYTMIGGAVNLAARLMQAATPDQLCLCDRATMEAAQSRLTFDPHPPLTLKGFNAPIPAFRPRPASEGEASGERERILVGRREERTVIAEALDRFMAEGGVRLILVEGEAGIGKSRLLAEGQRQAQARGLLPLVGAGDAVDGSAPYHAWRPILQGLLGAAMTTPTALAMRLGERAALAPLLAPLLPFPLPDNALTQPMRGPVRAANLHALIIALLREAAAQRPLLVVMEDAHWLDSASWALLGAICQRVRPLFLLLGTRPFAAAPPDEYQALLRQPDARYLPLRALDPADLLALICQRFGVAALPEAVADFLLEKGEGHPFFSEELAYALRDAGLITIAPGAGPDAPGQCALAPGVNLHAITFPDTVQGIILSRIDRLPPAHQLTLKVASVIGRLFARHLLHDIFPLEAERPHLDRYLQMLEQRDLTRLDSPAPELSYIFKHIITQEVAYSLLLHSHRRDLHRRIAQWDEAQGGADLSPLHAALAHHWARAGERARAVAFGEQAGEAALRAGANLEAANFFKETLSQGEGLPLDSVRRARWYLGLAEAQFGRGHLEEAAAPLREALRVLGFPVPTERAHLLATLAQEALRQGWHRLRAPRPSDPIDRARYAVAARACALLADLTYLTSEPLLGTRAVLQGLNLAERIEQTPTRARLYANMGIVAGMVPLHPIAQRYSALAQGSVLEEADPATAARVFVVTAAYAVGVARWAEADALLTRGSAIATRLSDHQQEISCAAVRAVLTHYQGKLAEALALNDWVYERARRTDNLIQQGWGLYSGAENLIHMGRYEEAIARARQALTLIQEEAKLTARMRALSVLGWALWQTGERAAALDTMGEAARLMRGTFPNVYSGLETYTNMAAFYLALWESVAQGASLPAPFRTLAELQGAAQQACRLNARFARMHPIGQPRHLLWEGKRAALSGDAPRARRCWQQAHAHATRLGMAHEVVLVGQIAGGAIRVAH